ncbi:DNA gyrase subunit B [Candidatus Giovannonibacteria bacterium RIFCSPLOWO2_01_FULL_43_160]|uniref:DNA topoisomerase (ATP-hydrolyzing) n=2 Tax=Candidatus Giovannoniibacteriota TaxID=1752738 RepID=A0A0G1IWK1_9BACT|nr:MAG: gyrase subunit B protein [Candidatus Giovannonibacteria bacterium GW2011_GWB1_43_13]KKS99676.1 MAG: gyrase subunit B protein [Candidatus Giovannonibacteria bacterium GW2011_GWA1_43_15]KKT20807.1 MAG: gyrase subunit B protein [Candidatus Giovannonibacteria bacterium GW2011_GWC2_43_8]KKT63761.1 MAG: gyrase subunit B protein [Candidatus Giovannonibacteria bacterium GW2011_GWA2_44_26]OGF58267.1 MAG: DNA gyrase subunit B [Candidatus Giovannonibacteria bacterium RIFCSPHIGHO2_01_FULL_43_140]O
MPKKTKKIAPKNEGGKGGSYTAKDIFVLEGLEPVRKRPGMYIGSTGAEGLHHLIWEVVDNSIDEAMAGYAKNIIVTLLPNHRVRVTDDGRGIPIEVHKQTKKSALETVMTMLHAGAKFGGEGYKVSGGLHGVGVSVVNALSSWMRAEVCRPARNATHSVAGGEGEHWAQEYQRGKPKTKVQKVGKCRKLGTSITFEPDPEIFADSKTGNIPEFDWKKILERLRQQAYLTKGIKISISDEREKNEAEQNSYSFYFEGGVASYVKYLNEGFTPKHDTIFYTQKESEEILVEIALQYVDDLQTRELAFANNILNPEGGMHSTGFRTALTRSLNSYARKNSYLKESEENLTGEDAREGLTSIISIKLKNPQFEGQTKAKLGNPEARTAVDDVFAKSFDAFLEERPQDARAILEKVILALKARKAAKAAKDTILRKGALDGLALPGKLADCQSKNPAESEIFIVEGDSAGGSAKQARDRRFQAILPLRGKILNVEKARLDRMLTSDQIKTLVIALGAAIAESFDLSKLRYHRIVIMTDADVDGAHIRTLLLTLFYRYYLPLIQKGYIYIAQPPLYKIQKGKEIKYVYSEEEKNKTVKYFDNPNIQRYKGLGEMNADELGETTMDPAKRVLRQVTIDDAKGADHIFDVLMGDDVAPRKLFIQTHAKAVKNLDI